MMQGAAQSDVAHPVEPPAPCPAISLDDLLIVLWLLPPDLHASDPVKKICAQLGFNVVNIGIKIGDDRGVVTDQVSGITQEFLLTERPAAPSPRYRELAFRLSGLVFGASFASAVVRRLVTLRRELNLTPHECIRLVHVAWPNTKHAGHWAEWRQPLEELLLALPVDEPVTDRIAVLRWLGTCYRWLGMLNLSAASVDQALELAASAQDRETYAHLLVDQAILQRYQRHHLSAQATLRAALAEFEQRQDHYGIARTRVELAQTAHETGKYLEAIELVAGLPETSRTLALTAEAQLSIGDYAAALDNARRAVAGSWCDRPNTGRAHATLGRVKLLLGDLYEAETELALALDLQESSHDALGYARTQTVRGRLFTLLRQYEAAEETLFAGLIQQENTADRAGMVATLNTILELYAVLATEALACGDTVTASRVADQIRTHRQTLDRLTAEAS